MTIRSRVRPEALFGLAIIPFTWWIVADWLQLVNPLLLPSLQSVLVKLGRILSSGSLLIDLKFTLWRWIVGFSFGAVAGILSGLVLGYSRRGIALFEFPIEFLRALPVTAIFPLYLIIFGVGDSAKIAMAFTPTYLLMLINTTYGVTLAEPTRRKMAKVFGATKFQIFRYVITFDALPQIFIGLRLAVSLSLVVTVVSEMFIGTDFGLGQRVYDSYLTNSVTTLYALLIVLGVLGYLLNKFVIVIGRRVVFWS